MGSEGTANFITLSCSTYNKGDETDIIWSLKDFQDGPSVHKMDNKVAPELFHISDHRDIYVQSQFAILNLSIEFDGVVVFCGMEKRPQSANFTIRVYRKCTTIGLVTCLTDYLPCQVHLPSRAHKLTLLEKVIQTIQLALAHSRLLFQYHTSYRYGKTMVPPLKMASASLTKVYAFMK